MDSSWRTSLVAVSAVARTVAISAWCESRNATKTASRDKHRARNPALSMARLLCFTDASVERAVSASTFSSSAGSANGFVPGVFTAGGYGTASAVAVAVSATSSGVVESNDGVFPESQDCSTGAFAGAASALGAGFGGSPGPRDPTGFLCFPPMPRPRRDGALGTGRGSNWRN